MKLKRIFQCWRLNFRNWIKGLAMAVFLFFVSLQNAAVVVLKVYPLKIFSRYYGFSLNKFFMPKETHIFDRTTSIEIFYKLKDGRSKYVSTLERFKACLYKRLNFLTSNGYDTEYRFISQE